MASTVLQSDKRIALRSVQQLCTPRKSLFETRFKDYALNLTDLAQGKIDAEEFFAENFITDGMRTLLDTAFDRFEGKSNISVVKLTQAMGGGKTHNMIALALLAATPALRAKYGFKTGLKSSIRVASFSGRESDSQYGIWGSIAQQIGKLDDFADYFRGVLKAPGETSWVNLLKGEPLLILLDELPPYLDYAASVSVGDSNLAVVTTSALSNLLVAVNKAELANVLVVISDLKAAYESGSAALASGPLKNFDHELNRTAMELEPVRQNSDEIYHILKSKLFEKVPTESEVAPIALAFGEELQTAKLMDITSNSPEEFVSHIKQSYPFHPAVRDLYARFKENPGFQQTRGLIRLLRAQVRSVFSDARKSESVYLLSPDAFDLNDPDTVTEINKINGTLKNAISHDIASAGSAEAEKLDNQFKTDIHQAATKTIMLSSLAAVQNAVLGLNQSDLVYYLAKPGRDLRDLKTKVLPSLKTTCWYLHLDRQGSYLFKNVQNIVAKINSLVATYNPDQAIKQVRSELEALFKPVDKDVYQRLSVLETPDVLSLDVDSVLLAVYQPNDKGAGLHPDLLAFYQNQIYKNRVLFLTGERAAMDSVLYTAKEIKAIDYVINELESDKISAKDPQYVEALSLRDLYSNSFRSAVRETFTKLYYPSADRLMDAEFFMQFSSNNYNGEQQIRTTLESKQKFTTDTDSDTFRKKCEKRLFGKAADEPREMEWAEIKKRAAREPIWQWHRSDALDRLKSKLVREKVWRENGKFVQTGPFEAAKTDIIFGGSLRDEETGAVKLRVEPQHGDKIYVDYGADPTTASELIQDHGNFETARMEVRFLCVDSTGKHPPGPVRVWKNKIDLKFDAVPRDGKVFVTLKAIPDAEIRYTTDGSSPRDVGGTYTGTFEVKKKSTIMAIASKEGVESEIRSFEVDPGDSKGARIDDNKPATVVRRHKFDGTDRCYQLIECMRRYQIAASHIEVAIEAVAHANTFISYSTGGQLIRFDADNLRDLMQYLRKPFTDGDQEDYRITLFVQEMHYKQGGDIQHFASEMNLAGYEPQEVKQ
ncbi:DUF499 domain-containing protein [Turneriella parva]|uniref:Glycosyl transferase n=1 Tax=Turneriella parva (strain ATCC BAA-1111 / DSM 21527 / NCTC 11395 / H) TaxID=869212 RepID=I4BAD3_TURPD|nr:DUF499 domain-containing protein [Turneriella parva]AFM14240.1 hypothetical protein Turpa_3606 [Turneriella parva DSM 21527]